MEYFTQVFCFLQHNRIVGDKRLVLEQGEVYGAACSRSCDWSSWQSSGTT